MRVSRGFTLIELMVTLAVLAIIVGIAAPSFATLVQGNRSATVSQELLGALQLARSEAVKRRGLVQVCRRNAEGSACATGTDWSAGWLVRESGGDIIRLWDAAPGLTVTGPQDGVQFRASGMASAGAGFSVAMSGCSAGKRSDITLGSTGHVSLAEVACP